MNVEFSLEGKVIVVTGAAGLIAAEVCDAYAAYGASVLLSDVVSEDELARNAEALREKYPGADVATVRCDVTSQDSVDALFEAVEARYGKVDVLVNLAAIDAKYEVLEEVGDRATRLEDFSFAQWERLVDVNCTGLLRVTKAGVAMMLRQKSGNVINVASTYSLVAPNHDLYMFPGDERPRYKPIDYVATKSVIPNLTRYIATLYARDGIRCNAVVPHGVLNGHPASFRDNFARLSPLGRMCDVRELRGPFVFLASDASSYMTGSMLVVDGGWTAW
jgi:NAD(P)-dependent dehydrogenase (short-subunit alcohol dehydrogenase family)